MSALPADPSERSAVLDIAIHDLRSPLANIRSYAEIACSGRVGGATAAVRRALEVILRNADKALALIQDDVDSRRGDFEAMALVRSSVSVSDLWKDLPRPQLRDRLAERGLGLEVEFEPGLPPVSLDARRVSRVLELLLERAAVRAPEGSRVLGFARREAACLAIGVASLDPALSRDPPDDLFDRQASVLRERQLLSGLALPLARTIARAHGGEAVLRPEGPLFACALLLPFNPCPGVPLGGWCQMGAVARKSRPKRDGRPRSEQRKRAVAR